MTINEAIEKVDAHKNNTYTELDKIGWLSDLDGLIHRTVILTHKHTDEEETFSGYDADTPRTTVLLGVYPFEEMYIDWVEAKIDFSNGEYTKYNNSITRFNDTYQAYCAWYNRTHMPNSMKRKFF